MFATEKRDDTIKARLVGERSNQRTYDGYNKSKVLSPTCATDSIFLTGVIDARERRAVAMLDIENTFLHAENDKKNLTLLRHSEMVQNNARMTDMIRARACHQHVLRIASS